MKSVYECLCACGCRLPVTRDLFRCFACQAACKPQWREMIERLRMQVATLTAQLHHYWPNAPEKTQ